MSQIASCIKCFVLSNKLQCCSLHGLPTPGRRRDALCHTGLTCSVPCIASECTLWPLVSPVLSVTGFAITKEEWQHCPSTGL